MIRFVLPAALFVVLVGFLYMGLGLNPRTVPSPFIGKVAPAFELPELGKPESMFKPEDMRGQVWLLNVWATWCVGCRQEHDALLRLEQRNLAPIIGFDYKDEAAKAEAWLQQLGNPYQKVIEDTEGRAAIDWGVYGAPETFIIDAKGIVRYKHIGPLSDAAVASDLVPMINTLKAEAKR